MEKHLLVIDDDAKLRRLLGEYLTGYGYLVDFLEDGSRVMDTLDSMHPDLIILDVMLPDRDGFDILLEIRGASRVPVIMLTAKGEDEDRIVGLEMGADDYLPKPFNPRELLARIKAVFRRLNEPQDMFEDSGTISAGGMTLDPARLVLTINGEPMELSTTETRLMQALMSRTGRALSRDQLMSMAWGRDYAAFDRSIDVQISRLRAKLAPYAGHEKRIRTVWGTGYMFMGDA
ncbi:MULTISPECIES: response regulator transcription factor [unclassified Pseudodesulfovibrio]|uniref:response regulator n=1 Tax=unclassified Pseudodesulfovibrio TaxID=2661612 RepID=UPI000FEBD4ED|nr:MULTISPECIES: response regulator transcription factor [unclassified Pseudodesulfovibrio]MCJ2165325.1 response regulator transcription factor [Pseudodesulfovibrio sp. S3-i]RWU02483.1 DNA-binding response regulator [Pseudodesulfovibrio sp. S3]